MDSVRGGTTLRVHICVRPLGGALILERSSSSTDLHLAWFGFAFILLCQSAAGALGYFGQWRIIGTVPALLRVSPALI
jgi:hypothetical protein